MLPALSDGKEDCQVTGHATDGILTSKQSFNLGLEQDLWEAEITEKEKDTGLGGRGR